MSGEKAGVVQQRKSDRVRSPVNYRILSSLGKNSDKTLNTIGESTDLVSQAERSPVPVGSPKQKSETERLSDRDSLTTMAEGTNEVVRSKVEMQEEREKLERQWVAFETEEEDLLERARLQGMRDKVASKEKRLQALREEVKKGEHSGKVHPDKKQLPDQASGTSNPLNIDSLREMGDLKQKMGKELQKLGLSALFNLKVDSDSSSSESSEASEKASDDELVGAQSKSKKKKKSKKSGIQAKISDKVKNRQDYPQAHLRYDFVSKKLEFQNLDMNLFVAGELEIISQCKHSKERNGRIDLLKKLMYLCSSYDFTVARALYAAVLREIELGHKDWGDDFHYVESAVLARHRQKVRSNFGSSSDQKTKSYHYSSAEDSSEKIWFCALFQRNKCQHKSAHTLVVKGKMRFAKHVCATCWQKDGKQLPHPECSSACPHASA